VEQTLHFLICIVVFFANVQIYEVLIQVHAERAAMGIVENVIVSEFAKNSEDARTVFQAGDVGLAKFDSARIQADTLSRLKNEIARIICRIARNESVALAEEASIDRCYKSRAGVLPVLESRAPNPSLVPILSS
jgi:hypothetical protein